MADISIVITPEAYTSPDPSSVEFSVDINQRQYPAPREELDIGVYEVPGLFPETTDNDNLDLVAYTEKVWTPQTGDPNFTDVALLMKFNNNDDVLLDESPYANSPYEYDDNVLSVEPVIYGNSVVDGFYIASGENAIFNFSNNWTAELSILPTNESEFNIYFTDTATGSSKGFYVSILAKYIYTSDYDAIADEYSSELIEFIPVEAYRKYDFAFVNESDIVSIYIDGVLVTTYGITPLTTNQFEFKHYTINGYGSAVDEVRFTAEARYSGASYTPSIPFATVAGSLGPTGGGSNTVEGVESASSASVLIVGSSVWETEGNIQTSSGIVGVKVFGTVRDELNNLASRTVRLHNRSTGALISEGTSDPVTGAFVLSAIENEYMYLVVFDNLAGPKNAKIYDRIIIET